MKKILKVSAYAMLALLVAGLIAAGAAVYVGQRVYDGLPGLGALTDYRPKMPLRVYTADRVLIGEFGEERRTVVAIKDMPLRMRQAVLAAEDDRFYEHGGVDFQGIARAALNNWRGGPRQGASTITQQLARNFYLTREQTFRRKAYEALLAWKIEREMSKDQILEVYMNQIFLGQRAYGFGSAAQIYFGKYIDQISLAQSAMLAGLPKAPSAYNPVANPKRSRERQVYVLGRMRSLGYIGESDYEKALHEKLGLAARVDGGAPAPGAEYVAEMARQFVVERFGEAQTYATGLSVYTTIKKDDQDAAVSALRHGVVSYDRAHGYRGPEAQLALPQAEAGADAAMARALADRREVAGMAPAVVMEAGPQLIRARLADGTEASVGPSGLALGALALSGRAPLAQLVLRGSIVRLSREGEKWVLAQLPEVASAFIASDPRDGAIKALVGGFDFNTNKFNRAAQAWRQPGSSFKPFIYSASLEKGMAPLTIINDSAFAYDPGNGGAIWEPKDYDGKTEGPMTMRRALALSKNLVSVRIVNAIGPRYAQEYAMRFGFDPAKNPPVLALALGAGAVTPIQMASAYSVFANGGFKVDPYLIERVEDASGNALYQSAPRKAGDESNRVIEESNAFIMDTMLRDVAQRGTAAKASAELKRGDLCGKTGTTNDALDAWFAGYHPDLVAVAWVGFDQPKSLGSRETGGGLALPIWIEYMAHALKGKPIAPKREMPSGVVQARGDFFLAAFPEGKAVASVGLDKEPAAGDADSEEPYSIQLPEEPPVVQERVTAME